MFARAINSPYFETGHLMRVALTSAAFGFLAWASLVLFREDAILAIIWLPNALLVAVLLKIKTHNEAAYFAGSFGANLAAHLLVGDRLLGSSILAFTNLFEIWLIVWLMRKIDIRSPKLDELRDLTMFTFSAGILVPITSRIVASLFLPYDGWSSWLVDTVQWAASHGLGLLLIAPPIMMILDKVAGTKSSSPPHIEVQLVERVIILAIIFLASVAIFGFITFPIFFVIAPIILLSAFRLGPLGTALSIIIISAVVISYTALHTGPFYSVSVSQTVQLFVVQLFLLSCFAVGLPVSTILASRELARQKLQEQDKLGKSMIENMQEVIFRTDARGEWKFLNPAWETLTGHSVKESLNQSIADIIPDHDIGELRKKYQPIFEGNDDRCHFDWAFERGDGSTTHVEISMSAIRDKNGEIEGTIGNIRDVSESKKIEKHLIAARRHAEAAADSKTRFLANMSHEIRTPMNGVIGFTQLLLGSDLPKEQHEQAQLILDSGEAMMRLLNNILDLSKIEAGHIKPVHGPFEPDHILKSCIKLMAPTANQKGVALRLNIDQSLPEIIFGDAHHLRQIILNLLGNAVKFTERGQITLAAELQQDGEHGGTISIVVEDTGIGISASRLAAIFDPFEQAENSITQKFGGSGLGLTISRQLATLMGGNLSVESIEGKGSKFRLQFPARNMDDFEQMKGDNMNIETPAGLNQISGAPRKSSIVNGRLLLVEDHDVNQMLITAMTNKLGYETTLAVDGADAVAKVDQAMSTGDLYDLVLMDVQMPVMDGFQATRMIRTSGISAEQLPIIAITANAYQEDIESCLAVGMQAHIAKPVMIDKLKSALERWVKSDVQPGHVPLSELSNTHSDHELRSRYRQRKEEVIDCLTSIGRRSSFSDSELQEAADHLHKLAGTAAIFGEEDLGIKARNFENGLTQWNIQERPEKIKLAIQGFLEAA